MRRALSWMSLPALIVVSAADAQVTTRLASAQCKAVAVAMGQVFEALPRNTLSLPFRQSATAFVKVGLDCPIKHRIEIASDADARALDDVIAMLIALVPPVDVKPSFEIVDLRPPPPTSPTPPPVKSD